MFSTYNWCALPEDDPKRSKHFEIVIFYCKLYIIIVYIWLVLGKLSYIDIVVSSFVGVVGEIVYCHMFSSGQFPGV